MKCLWFASRAVGAATLASLITSAAFASEAFVGRWAMKPEVCSARGGETPDSTALVATDKSLWWYDGYCSIGKMYKAKAVYVQAHCGTKDVPVTLDAQSDRLRVTWDRKVEDLQRCN
jgi:hypothetical protein